MGASTWLPFAENLERYLLGGPNRTNHDVYYGNDDAMGDDAKGDEVQVSEADAFVREMTASARRTPRLPGTSEANRHAVPMSLAHGTDDAYVDIELGRQAARVLRKVVLMISWREYSGADQEGHWLKEPEEIDNIVDFLATISTSV